MSARWHRFVSIVGCLLVACLASCSYKHYLPPGERLYLGADVKLVSKERLRHKKYFQSAAEDVIRPQPNHKVLGMRPRLWLYNIAGKPKSKKGLRHWLKYKVGEAPVLYSQVNAYKTSQFIDARLFNLGMFNATTIYTLKQDPKSVKVIYQTRTHPPYYIDSIAWPTGDDDLTRALADGKKHSLLKVGQDYDLDVLKSERQRLDSLVKNRGFFYFSPDYIRFDADTSLGDRRVAVSVHLSDDIPYAAALIYRINDVYVLPDYSVQNDTTPKADTVVINKSVRYVSRFHSYRPNAILKAVFIGKDSLYSRRAQDMTLNRVMGLGVFKYANVRYFDADTSAPGFLNAYIEMTPLPRKSLRFEVNGVSKSNDYVGPHLNFTLHNRNALRGGESLTLGLTGTYEVQLRKGSSEMQYSIGPQVEFSLPRFVTPFNIRAPHNYYQPRTRFLLSYEYVRRTALFGMNRLNGLAGYKWRSSAAKDYELNPVDITYVKLVKETPAFAEALKKSPLLKRSYQEQFIAGMSAAYTYNEQVFPQRVNQFFFAGRTETSGNLLWLASKAAGQPTNPENPTKIGGSPFAQYVRFEADARDYLNNFSESKLVFRTYVGVAKTYGNADRIPYIKRFFSGGPNSVRAFRVHGIGPGTYRVNDSLNADFLNDVGGDFKLEGNAEYRFPIYKYFKGALFMDAGNVWLIKPDTLVPGGEFHWHNLFNQLGIGGGIGLRLDANYFVLRVDLAMPLREPWLAPDERWVINRMKFKSPTWRRDNLVLNIAIGYPF